MPNWVRKGECNHCGWCCIFSFDPVGVFFADKDKKRNELLQVRGFRPAENEGEQGYMAYGDVYLPCPQHIDNKCAIYEKRPELCRTFPLLPTQVVGTPCSYWFEDEEGKELPVGGDASPYARKYGNFEVLKRMGAKPRTPEEVENG